VSRNGPSARERRARTAHSFSYLDAAVNKPLCVVEVATIDRGGVRAMAKSPPGRWAARDGVSSRSAIVAANTRLIDGSSFGRPVRVVWPKRTWSWWSRPARSACAPGPGARPVLKRLHRLADRLRPAALGTAATTSPLAEVSTEELSVNFSPQTLTPPAPAC